MTTDRVENVEVPSLHRISTSELSLVFAPEVGGRLLSLVADGRELLWRNPEFLGDDLVWTRPRAQWPDGSAGMSSWPNIGGSKSWPAPQGWSDAEQQWAGPPDPVLDSGAFSWECVRTDVATTVTMQSGFDERSGLRVSRRFEIPHVGRAFAETVTFANHSDRPRTWSIWEVVQIDTTNARRGATSGAVVSTDDGRVTDLGTYRGGPRARREGAVTVLPLVAGVAKRGFPSASGTIGYRENGRTLVVLAFAPEEGADYPDGQSRAAVWMQSPQSEPIVELGGLRPDASLIELEVLSPLHTIAPGGSASLSIDWHVP